VKNTLILRKDIQINTNRLVKMAVLAGAMLSQDITNIDVLEVVTKRELEDLEEVCIEEGIKFDWLEDGKTVVGIVLYKQETKPSTYNSYKKYEPDVKVVDI
jgi:hypothetical protein